LSKKIVASDAEVSAGSASIAGATAAMALPPQIPVPAQINAPIRGVNRNHRAKSVPTANVANNPMTV
jgi:hypothetical protein